MGTNVMGCKIGMIHRARIRFCDTYPSFLCLRVILGFNEPDSALVLGKMFWTGWGTHWIATEVLDVSYQQRLSIAHHLPLCIHMVTDRTRYRKERFSKGIQDDHVRSPQKCQHRDVGGSQDRNWSRQGGLWSRRGMPLVHDGSSCLTGMVRTLKL